MRKRKLNDKAVVRNVVVENQTIDEIQATSPKKLPQKLPDSEKFENITRPQVALNCDTLAKKRKFNKGSQTKPKDKDIVNNQVSKNIFLMYIHIFVTLLSGWDRISTYMF